MYKSLGFVALFLSCTVSFAADPCSRDLSRKGSPELRNLYDGLDVLFPGVTYDVWAASISTEPTYSRLGTAMEGAAKSFSDDPRLETRRIALRVISAIKSGLKPAAQPGGEIYDRFTAGIDALAGHISTCDLNGPISREIYTCNLVLAQGTEPSPNVKVTLSQTRTGYDLFLGDAMILRDLQGPALSPRNTDDLVRGYGYRDILEFSGVSEPGSIASVELYRFDHNWTDDARFIVYKDKAGRPIGGTFVQVRPIACRF